MTAAAFRPAARDVWAGLCSPVRSRRPPLRWVLALYLADQFALTRHSFPQTDSFHQRRFTTVSYLPPSCAACPPLVPYASTAHSLWPTPK